MASARNLETPAPGAAATRERLLDAAEHLFAQHGFQAASVRDITRRARCNIAAVHYHFRDKDGLYVAVWRRRLEVVRSMRGARMEAALAKSGEPVLEDVVRAFVTAQLEWLGARDAGPRLARLTAWERLDSRLPADMLLEEHLEPSHRAFRRALAKTCPGLSDLAARQCMHAIVGILLHGTRMRDISPRGRSSSKAFETRPLIEHAVLFASAGLRACAAGTRKRK